MIELHYLICATLLIGFLFVSPVSVEGSPTLINAAAPTTERLTRLRALMATQELKAYLVPTADAHLSGKVSEHDARRAYISGYTGSAGTALITGDKALLWTDARYYLEAEEQLDSNWELMRESDPGTPSRVKWLVDNLPPNSKVGANPAFMSNAAWESHKTALQNAGHTLEPVNDDLVDQVWDDGSRPPLPANVIFPLEIKYTGVGTGDKLTEIRAKMAERKVSMLIVSALDEVAYLLNFRGSDIPYNPLFYTYCIVTPTKLVIFTRENLLSSGALAQLREQGAGDVEIQPYANILVYIRNKVSEDTTTDTTDPPDYVVWVPRTSGQALHLAVTERPASTSERARKVVVVPEITPLVIMKVVKNKVEAEGLAECHLRDGTALVRYFSWLEDELVKKGRTDITEKSASDQLKKFKEALPEYMGLSFETISGSGPNGAIVHYRPQAETSRKLSIDELYLCDSGLQCRGGTTDVTRTMHFGSPTKEERESFTLVLKGQISIAKAIFPYRTTGNLLDTLARYALWQTGVDFAHGTGHGIGHFLSVHEGPIGIFSRQAADDPGFQENMFVSNEPGYYETGKYGIRIEDIVRVVTLIAPSDTPQKGDDLPRGLKENFAGRGALGFETITMCPIQRKMIVLEMLTELEREHIDEYHKTVLTKLSPFLQGPEDKQALAWLQENTKPLKSGVDLGYTPPRAIIIIVSIYVLLF